MYKNIVNILSYYGYVKNCDQLAFYKITMQSISQNK